MNGKRNRSCKSEESQPLLRLCLLLPSWGTGFIPNHCSASICSALITLSIFLIRRERLKGAGRCAGFIRPKHIHTIHGLYLPGPTRTPVWEHTIGGSLEPCFLPPLESKYLNSNSHVLAPFIQNHQSILHTIIKPHMNHNL